MSFTNNYIFDALQSIFGDLPSVVHAVARREGISDYEATLRLQADLDKILRPGRSAVDRDTENMRRENEFLRRVYSEERDTWSRNTRFLQKHVMLLQQQIDRYKRSSETNAPDELVAQREIERLRNELSVRQQQYDKLNKSQNEDISKNAETNLRASFVPLINIINDVENESGQRGTEYDDQRNLNIEQMYKKIRDFILSYRDRVDEIARLRETLNSRAEVLSTSGGREMRDFAQQINGSTLSDIVERSEAPPQPEDPVTKNALRDCQYLIERLKILLAGISEMSTNRDLANVIAGINVEDAMDINAAINALTRKKMTKTLQSKNKRARVSNLKRVAPDHAVATNTKITKIDDETLPVDEETSRDTVVPRQPTTTTTPIPTTSDQKTNMQINILVPRKTPSNDAGSSQRAKPLDDSKEPTTASEQRPVAVPRKMPRVINDVLLTRRVRLVDDPKRREGVEEKSHDDNKTEFIDEEILNDEDTDDDDAVDDETDSDMDAFIDDSTVYEGLYDISGSPGETNMALTPRDPGQILNPNYLRQKFRGILTEKDFNVLDKLVSVDDPMTGSS